MPHGLPQRLLHLVAVESLDGGVLDHGLLRASRGVEPHSPLLLAFTIVEVFDLPPFVVGGMLQGDQFFGEIHGRIIGRTPVDGAAGTTESRLSCTADCPDSLGWASGGTQPVVGNV